MGRSLTEYPTECPLCIAYEETVFDKVRRGIRNLIFPPTYSEIFKAQSGVLKALLGTPKKTWYEIHRENYELGGKEIELERMKRHIHQR